MHNSKTSCSALWRSLYYNDMTNEYRVCCDFKPVDMTKRVGLGSVEEYLASDVYQELKSDMSQGKWHEGCKTCEIDEERGMESQRQSFNRQFKLEDIKNDQDFQIKYLDYRPGNLCNLKCRMCTPMFSSVLAKELNDNPELKQYASTKVFDMMDVAVGQLIKDEKRFEHLEVLKVLGGEPTIDPQIYDLLEFVIAKGYAKNITLKYTTNATNQNKRWLNLIQQFKRVGVTFSCDGTGKTYEYIRTPAKWESVKKNILNVGEITNLSRTGFNVVFSVWNCFTVDEWLPELIQMSNKISGQTEQDRIQIINCTHPKGSQVFNMPDQFKQIVLDKLKTLPQHHTVVQQLIHYTQLPQRNNTATKSFFDYNDKLDRIRKTNINDISEHYETLRQNTL